MLHLLVIQIMNYGIQQQVYGIRVRWIRQGGYIKVQPEADIPFSETENMTLQYMQFNLKEHCSVQSKGKGAYIHLL